jgi:hypothetical protein
MWTDSAALALIQRKNGGLPSLWHIDFHLPGVATSISIVTLPAFIALAAIVMGVGAR